MDMSNPEEEPSRVAMIRAASIQAFKNVTGCTDADAVTRLDAAQWDYNLAVTSFFDNEEDLDVYEVPFTEAIEPKVGFPAPKRSRKKAKQEETDTETKASGSKMQKNEDDMKSKQDDTKENTSSFKAQKGENRIATLASLRQDEDDSSEEGQAFYAGGSVRSGQQVIGPSKQSGTGFVDQMLRSARSHGAEVVDPEEIARVSSTQQQAFSGVGHVLGSSLSESGSSHVSTFDTSAREEPVPMYIRAWRNGFTINDGPLQEYDLPENKRLLDAIHKGEVPPELNRLADGREVSLHIADHSREDFVSPEPAIVPFSGVGHRLGSPTPQVLSANSLDIPIIGGTDAANLVRDEAKAAEMLNVDSSGPVTTVQVRLADGTKLTLKLNSHHSVHDIRRYITIARPEYSAVVFDLITTFPTRKLDDGDTVESANLFNCVLVQKLS